MLKDVDVLVFDMQDVGCRIYTFVYTLANCMRAAARLGKRVVVCDRPNPINGVAVEVSMNVSVEFSLSRSAEPRLDYAGLRDETFTAVAKTGAKTTAACPAPGVRGIEMRFTLSEDQQEIKRTAVWEQLAATSVG